MPILPVLDIQHGQVVRGIAGRRADYRPIVSRLTASTQPLDVARALHEHFGFRELYVADLDAIGGAAPADGTLAELIASGFSLWVDRGVRTLADVAAAWQFGPTTAVLALETLAGPQVLSESCRRYGSEWIVFSLDLHGGRALGNRQAWGTDQPGLLAQWAIEARADRLLLLDLASVGVGAGPSTAELCRRLRRQYPFCELTTGGGVRGPEDVRELYAAGADHVLVASALHDGRLSAADVAVLQQQ